MIEKLTSRNKHNHIYLAYKNKFYLLISYFYYPDIIKFTSYF